MLLIESRLAKNRSNLNLSEYVRQGGLRYRQNCWKILPTEPPSPNASKNSETKKDSGH